MKTHDRESYSAGYGEACLAALLAFGPPPSRYENSHSVIRKYHDGVMEWWLSTQNEGTSEKRGYKFLRYYLAWCKDQQSRGRINGII